MVLVWQAPRHALLLQAHVHPLPYALMDLVLPASLVTVVLQQLQFWYFYLFLWICRRPYFLINAQCPNGVCSINDTACKSNCSGNGYLCYDETCTDDIASCPTVSKPFLF